MVTGELLSAMLLLPLLVAVIGLLARPAPLASVVDLEGPAEPAPADRTPSLLSQFTAGVRGSRAPPVASV